MNHPIFTLGTELLAIGSRKSVESCREENLNKVRSNFEGKNVTIRA